MKFLVVVFVLCIAFAVASGPAINFNIIKKINSQPSTWVAGINQNFQNASIDRIKGLLGWKPNGNKLPTKQTEVNIEVPQSFDSSKQWPNCKTIGTIYDQARCGSCWAFGAVEAISDRFCIEKNQSLLLSFMDMVACGPDSGCEGGDAGDAWNYAQNTGLVTNPCSPYTIPTCPPAQEPCLNFVDTPACVQSCSDGETWSNSKHFLSNAYSVGSDQQSIMQEVYTNGPVEACFSVYEDFLSYKSGVYQHTTGDFLGGHCVKVIGWGVLNSTPYWLVNNQWTTYWGDKGQFKILRGSDECGIEDDVVAGVF